LWRFCGSDSARPKREAFAGSSLAACESEATAKPLMCIYPIKDSLIVGNQIHYITGVAMNCYTLLGTVF